MSAMGPSPGWRNGCALMCTIAGSMNASVFPDPARRGQCEDRVLGGAASREKGSKGRKASRPERALRNLGIGLEEWLRVDVHDRRQHECQRLARSCARVPVCFQPTISDDFSQVSIISANYLVSQPND